MVAVQSEKSRRDWVDFERTIEMFSPTASSKSGSKSRRHGSAARTRPDSEERTSWMSQPINTNSTWVPVAPPPIDTGTATSTTKYRIEPVNPSPRDTASKSRSGRTSTKEKKRPHDVPRPEPLNTRSRTISTSTVTVSENEGAAAPSSTANSGTPSQTRHPLSQPRPSRGREEKKEKTDDEKRSSRGRSKSRSRIATTPKRDRSSSKTRQSRPKSRTRGTSVERKTRGASVERPVRGASVERTKVRDRSRPPVTRNGREGRSRTRSHSLNPDGRPRARSRSASLTRVTNPGHAAPLSPSVKSMGRGFDRPPTTNPPSTIRSRGELRRNGATENHRPLRTVPTDDGSLDARIGRDISFGNKVSSNGSVTSQDRRKRSGLLGKLFGDHNVNSSRGGFSTEQVRPRILLAATVYHNTATGLWITTINTNQRGVAKNPSLANKYLKAFSFPSEHEARESAIANAPPKMVSFHDSRNCYMCEGTFAVFRRASHCRNCGVCICKDCSVQWPSKMLPDTYNLKNETTLRVCRSCNAISRAFRIALTEGDYEEAISLYGTGNVNLRTPFPTSTKKEETMYPIHCAVEGGNIEIVRWLVDGHFCPIKKVQAGSKKARRGTPESLITTSRNRHVLSIAIQRLQVDMIRYLVVDCGVSIHESTDLESSLRAMEATLMRLPRTVSDAPRPEGGIVEPRWDNASFDEVSEPSTLSGERSLYEDSGTIGSKSHKTKGDSCIICFDRKINCVCTPCGHQMCCLECSSNLKACPVCNARGEFIKIFRP